MDCLVPVNLLEVEDQNQNQNFGNDGMEEDYDLLE
jgi:ATP-dependent Lon protease